VEHSLRIDLCAHHRTIVHIILRMSFCENRLRTHHRHILCISNRKFGTIMSHYRYITWTSGVFIRMCKSDDIICITHIFLVFVRHDHSNKQNRRRSLRNYNESTQIILRHHNQNMRPRRQQTTRFPNRLLHHRSSHGRLINSQR